MVKGTADSARGGAILSADSGSGRMKRRSVWVAIAVLLALGGTVSTVFAAGSFGNNAQRASRRAFATSSADIASTLQLAIQHENDLVVSASSYFLSTRSATNSDFRSWLLSMRALERYPELQGIGIAVIVTPAQLPAFAAQAVADPAGPLAADGTFQIVPPGSRPFYCLPAVGQSRIAGNGPSAGFDFCAADKGSQIFGSRDSGHGMYIPLTVGNNTLLNISIPIYRGGNAPTTTKVRRAAFVGSVGLVTFPAVLLDRALQGHPGKSVSMRYRAGSSDVAFNSTVPARGTDSVVTNLNDGWTVTTFGAVAIGGVLADGTSIALLVSGIALSLLLALLILILSTGRARALALVGRKTGELRHQALHDALTGLPNRALITDRIEQLLARNRRHGTMGAALFVDLDGFKDINDTLGHAAGDKLLQAVALRLTTGLRDADTIGRMGGDEFIVLIDGATTNGAPELVAQRLLDLMRQPFTTLHESAIPIVITTSIGVAIGDRDTAGELLRDADVAMYMAKSAGKNCFEVFHPDMESDVTHRYRLEFDLRSALGNHQFRLVYQPIYNLDDLTLVGVEALLRWEHPTLGQIQPDEFIALLESSGEILDVGRWVLREACTQMAAWRERGSDLIISVNVSGRQLDRDVIVDDVRDALTQSGLDPAVLTLEVTETALMRDIDTTARRLRELKDLGVQIAIDDFGTGYSSLAYLQEFPVDCLKIDRSFTDTIAQSPAADAIIHTLVQLGKHLGLKTLAEGIESAGQVDHLRGEAVNEAQGFLMSRPLDPETLEAQLLQPARTELDRISRTPDLTR
jgi:diguanylate cyclase (GGDEF)-like protein